MANRYSPRWFHGKRVTVMGLGLHGGGLAVARWILRHGADVAVTDLKSARALAPSVRELKAAARERGSGRLQFTLGSHRAKDFRAADLVVQNPGVPRTSPYLVVARRARVPVTNEARLFIDILRGLPEGTYRRPHMIAVTGTRGKSTTSALIAAMLEASGRPVILAGNIRIPMFDVLDRILRESRSEHVAVVLEFSSWHCEHLSPRMGAPDVAVWTNLLRDHLNRYRTMRAYVAAKVRLIRAQDPKRGIAVLNADDPLVWSFRRTGPQQVRWFSMRCGRAARGSGAYLDGETLLLHDGRRAHPVATVRDLRIPGAHNVRNALAAIATAQALTVPPIAMRRALRSFSGLPGRLEHVATRRGVRFVNDTTATTPDAVIAALQALPQKRVVLIAGGTDKDLAFDAWAEVVVERAQAVVFLPGTATEKMRAMLAVHAHDLDIRDAPSMPAAVRATRRLASRGDIVLLSPGAASFGLFVHEFDRGDQFSAAARALP